MLSTNLSVIMAAPVWSQKEWSANVLALLVEEALILPMLWNLLVQPQVRKLLQGLGSLRLHEWRLSSDFHKAGSSKAVPDVVVSDLRRSAACLYQGK